jgi:hypothetical protein
MQFLIKNNKVKNEYVIPGSLGALFGKHDKRFFGRTARSCSTTGN